VAFQLLDDSASLDEETDLAADSCHHAQQLLVRFFDLAAEEFQDAYRLAG